MIRLCRLVFILLMSAAVPCLAQGLGKVTVKGVAGELKENVEKSLSLMRVPEEERAAVSQARLDYLLKAAPSEIDRALQPYGHYQSSVQSKVSRKNGAANVTLTIEPGEPVQVMRTSAVVQGDASEDEKVSQALSGIGPREGEPLDHRRHEAGKLAVQRVLLERGYFDAQLETHRVAVRRAAQQAEIDLSWTSGPRYRFGTTRFAGSHIRDSLLEKTIPYEQGEPYEQAELLDLHQRLTQLDYFGYIDVRPEPSAAQDGEVPIEISLIPGKRTVYTAGLSYGTDSGPGVQLGVERRWVNDRGHKLAANLDWAQRRRSLGVEYRIPAFAWAEGWYVFGANRREEDSDTVETRITELVASRTGVWRGWNLSVAVHTRQEEFRIGGGVLRGGSEGDSFLLYPALSASYVDSDHAMYPTRGYSVRGEVKFGAQALLSDVDFVQALLDAKLIRSLGPNNRFLFRGQLGRTVTDEFSALPPSLRFFAGGDRSIRGYGYQEVGPRETNALGTHVPTGGKNLLTGSAEYERMFTPSWGAAAFVDAGNAFNEVNEGAYVGAGLGVRWRSPVGMVRFDLAHGFKDADNSIQIHINIGPDL